MITPEQAQNALEYLTALSGEGLDYILMYSKDTYNYNYGMRIGAIKTLKEFIAQHKSESEIKIVYAFKLRREDGLYMDRSLWSKKGKVYQRRNFMNAAITNHIETPIQKAYSKTIPVRKDFESDKDWNTAYRENWNNTRDNKEWKSQFIPENWIVECIPMNTKADIISMSARDFYMGKEIKNVQNDQ